MIGTVQQAWKPRKRRLRGLVRFLPTTLDPPGVTTGVEPILTAPKGPLRGRLWSLRRDPPRNTTALEALGQLLCKLAPCS